MRNCHATVLNTATCALEYRCHLTQSNQFYAGLSSSQMIQNSGNVCCGPHFSHQWQVEIKYMSRYEGCINANWMGDLNMCEGTTEVEAYIGIVQRHLLPSRRHISWKGLILHMLKHCGF